MVSYKFLSLPLPLVLAAVTGQANDELCTTTTTRCKRGPTIRFPFQLRNQHPLNQCGYPGFQLSCSQNYKDTILELHYSLNTSINGLYLSYYIKASVTSIDYEYQYLDVQVLDLNVVPLSMPLRSNSPPFVFSKKWLDRFYDVYFYNYAFFNCSATSSQEDLIQYYWDQIVDSLSNDDFQVYAVYSSSGTFEPPIISCTKMYNIISPWEGFYPAFDNPKNLRLTWNMPDCVKCESKKEYCKLIDNTTRTTTCYPIPMQPGSGHKVNKLFIAGLTSSVFLLVLLLIALYYVIWSKRRKEEDRKKFKIFMEDYKALKPTRYSFSDIKKVTDNFKDKLGQGGFGSVYKGRIFNDIFVAVKVLNRNTRGNGEDFITEVGTIGQIHHINVVRLVGYCADGCDRALVYEFLPNNSLDKYVYSAKLNRANFLGWEKMQEIALGIAKGIEYLHKGCAQQILHFDIKPQNILLDQNFNPKVADFGLAKLCSKEKSNVSMTMARGTIGYIAPEVFSRNFGNVSSKSDVYSFGMLLQDMVGGKNNPASIDGEGSSSQVYFPEWIFHRMEQGQEMVIQIENEDDAKITKKLTIVGLWCIGWHPVDRPSMTRVIQMLQQEECPAMPPNPFSSMSNGVPTSVRSFDSELEVISESE